MIKNAKKVINSKVFKWQTGTYLGKISDISFSEDGYIKGYTMSTDSLIPIDRWIFPGAVRRSGKGKMYVDDVSEVKEKENRSFKNSVRKKDIVKNGIKIGVGKDMLFDSETGEIQGFLYSENIFSKPLMIDANKLEITGKNKTEKSERSEMK